MQHLPQNPHTLEQAIDLRFDLRSALHPLANHEQISAHLQVAETLAEALDDQQRLGWCAVYLSNYFWWMGNQERAMRNIVALDGERIRERFGLAGLASVLSRTILVWTLAERGKFIEGRIQGEEEVRIAETAHHPFSLLMAYFGVGILSLRQGALPKALPLLERALEICRGQDIPIFFAWIASLLGYTLALSGQVMEALPLLEQAVDQMTGKSIRFSQSLWTGWLSEAYFLAGRQDDHVLTLSGLSSSPVHTMNGDTRLIRFDFSEKYIPITILQTAHKPKITINKPSPSPPNWTCAPCKPTAIVVLAYCIARPGKENEHAPNSP